MNWEEDNLPPPQKSNLGIFLAVAALLLGAYIGFSIFRNKQPLPPPPNEGIVHPAVGIALNELRLEPLLPTSDAVTSDDLKGKVALVNFWGTWCPPCRVEFPHLVTLQRDFAAEKDFQFVSVSVTSDGGDELQVKDDTEKFLAQHKAEFPVYIDPNGASRRHLMKSAELKGIGYPTTVLLDREGVIRGLWMGYYSGLEKHLAETIRKTLTANPAQDGGRPNQPQVPAE